MPLIEAVLDSAIGTIILDHARKRNALSKDAVATIMRAVLRHP